MGLGAFLAKYVKTRLLETFVEIEIWIGLLGGLSSLIMFAANVYIQQAFPLIFYLLCAGLGILVGVEIPLLVRVIRSWQGISSALSHVLAIDYIGALIGSILFPFVVLPLLGLGRASIAFGLMNLSVAAVGLKLVSGKKNWMIIRLCLATAILATAFATSKPLMGYFENCLYQDDIIFTADSPYQHIVLTRWRDDVRLFLNGHIQFSSVDEARYHEALVRPAMEAAVRPRNILILGGGDGLAAREALKYETVESITIVDIDPTVTRLARERKELLAINENSLASDKVAVINGDAWQYILNDVKLYEVIIIDLPDPNTTALAKLYSSTFYDLAAKRLAPGGIMVTQATSPFFAREAFWCVVETMSAATIKKVQDEVRLDVLPYHVHVPSFGEWGFVMASDHSINPSDLELSVPTRFLTNQVMQAMFAFGRDIAKTDVEVNELIDPVLHRYYEKGWGKFNQ